ncbi:unnamed protein product [Didymodactylos carnosus]|uniref:HPP transmembrane region domain-containing protein n=1 Tax=Didymodactylos carnosus TaxID=1234261 RepID=A0A815SI82_9BILA|nr:unnamed protein product [Didymodactylos carnosus]CAF1551804.1 unnamed protein product [Didymodactylos carnosus]CAF4342048.1 unnamed protein product [Didymodactylos carnosus]CAF4354085.1 unnamed protein product [Didymodactylos carnosus]
MKDTLAKPNASVQVSYTGKVTYIVNSTSANNNARTGVYFIQKSDEHSANKNISENVSQEMNFDEPASTSCGCLKWIKCYFRKWSGKREKRPPRATWEDLAWSFIGSIISMGIVAVLHYRLLRQKNFIFLIGSFGATAVLLFAQPKAVVSQPRNMIGGQLICATVGCIIRILLVEREQSVAAVLAVSISIVLMQFTETLHPPAGATALIAVIGIHPKEWAGFVFIFIPVLSAQLVMLCTALIINNISPNRSYPTFWW